MNTTAPCACIVETGTGAILKLCRACKWGLREIVRPGSWPKKATP